MTDDAAFLRAIIAAPDDDVPRLVYADWLDERDGTTACPACGSGAAGARVFRACKTCGGSGCVPDAVTARAEFIRVQCQLAWMEEAAPSSFRDGDGVALRRRERELLGRHGPWWLGFRVPTGQTRGEGPRPSVAFSLTSKQSVDAEAAFSRGFVSEITLSWAAWCANWQVILDSCPVRRVDRAPARPCPACGGDGLATGPPECRRCRRCRGSGRRPAEVPDWRGDGVVRLTGPRRGGDAHEMVRRLTVSGDTAEGHGDWAGVLFKLPPR